HAVRHPVALEHLHLGGEEAVDGAREIDGAAERVARRYVHDERRGREVAFGHREADRGGGSDGDQEHEEHQAPAGFDDLEELAQNHEGIPLWISPGRRRAARLSCDLACIITGALAAEEWQTAQATSKRAGGRNAPAAETPRRPGPARKIL